MAAGITPPGSVIEPPPTQQKPLSNSAQSVVNFLQLHRAGHRSQPWCERRLQLDDYMQVLRLLNADESLRNYAEDKVRPVGDFANEIEHFVTSRILIPQDTEDRRQLYARREPETSFGHRQLHYPGVIVEICYSQKSQHAFHLADKYILNTNRSVNTVIILDINLSSKRATVIIWRAGYITVDGMEKLQATTMVKAQPFRTDCELPVKGGLIQLSLRDFATDDLYKGNAGLDRQILITSKQLFDFLSSAEARQQSLTQFQGSVNRVRPGALKRRRPQTPPEQVSSEDDRSVERERQSKRER